MVVMEFAVGLITGGVGGFMIAGKHYKSIMESIKTFRKMSAEQSALIQSQLPKFDQPVIAPVVIQKPAEVKPLQNSEVPKL